MLRRMDPGKYNEIIIRSDVWQRDPLATIEATFGAVPALVGVPHVRFDSANRQSPFS